MACGFPAERAGYGLRDCSYIIIDHCVGGWWSKGDMKGMMSMQTRNDINVSPPRARALNLNLASRHRGISTGNLIHAVIASDAPRFFDSPQSCSVVQYCPGRVHTSIFVPLSERERNNPRTISTLQIFLIPFPSSTWISARLSFPATFSIESHRNHLL